jgi:hypothetical protein
LLSADGEESSDDNNDDDILTATIGPQAQLWGFAQALSGAPSGSTYMNRMTIRLDVQKEITELSINRMRGMTELLRRK